MKKIIVLSALLMILGQACSPNVNSHCEENRKKIEKWRKSGRIKM